MSWITGLRSRLRQLLGRADAEERMDEEIRFHIELETEKNVREGLAPEEARRRAVLAFGGVEKHREEMRDNRRLGWLENGARDVRYAVRVNGLTGLAVTKMDVLDSFAEIPVCTAYRLDGTACEEMPAEVDALGREQPIYEVHQGWQQPTGGARKLADLPKAARAYLDRLEVLSGAPVRYVSVGTRRDQIIEV